MSEQGSRMLRRAVALIERPEMERSEEEMEILIPWFAKIATPFHALEKDKLMTLLRYCEYKKVPRDEVIIRQGTIGDCFYVMLSGKASLHIDLAALDDPDKDDECREGREVTADEDKWEEVWDRSGKRYLRLDRSKFGGYITSFEAGKGFGEMALIDTKSIRSGSIIADEECELLVIDRGLFDETLKERQEADRKKRWEFIETSSLFSSWPTKMKRLLDMSLVQRVYPFDCCVVRQGRPVTGLDFIIRGQALVTVDARMHQHQYPSIFDKKGKILAELNSSRNAEKKEAPSAKDSQFPAEQKMGQPEVDHVTGERHLPTKCQNICAIDQTEVIGAMEFVIGLDTYAQNVVSKSELEVFHLDSRSIDRLVNRARNSSTSGYLVDRVHERLKARMTFGAGTKVELYRHLSEILDERKRKELLDQKSRPKKDDSGNRTGHPTAGPDDHQRLPSGGRSTAPGGHSLTLTAYYKSNIADRTGRFSRAYLQSREGGYGRQQTDLSIGGRRLMMERATRLLPRSRRELEHVALGLKDAKPPKPKRKHNDAIQRYLSTPQNSFVDPEKLDLVRGLIQEADQVVADGSSPTGTIRSAFSSAIRPKPGSAQPNRTVGSAYSYSRRENGTRSGSSESEDDDEEAKEVLLGLEETVSDLRLRNVALKIGDHHQELNEERKHNIFFSVFDSRRMPADKKQSMMSKMFLRPNMTPGSTKIAFDKESSDETLTFVEDKLRRFYSGFETKENDSPVVQQLRRFKITTAEDAPIPAGTVYVCRRLYGNPASRSSSHSNHRNDDAHGETANGRRKVRRYMIPKTAYPLLINALPKQDDINNMAEEMKEMRRHSKQSGISSFSWGVKLHTANLEQ